MSLLKYFARASPSSASSTPSPTKKACVELSEEEAEAAIYEKSAKPSDDEISDADDEISDAASGEDSDQGSPDVSARPHTKSTHSKSTSASSKHSKSFHVEWITGRPWLRYDAERQGMICLWCKKYDKKPYNRTTWNKEPCTRLRLESVIRHAAHRECLRHEKAQETNRIIPATINPALPSKGMEQAFASLYFLAKQRIPHTTNFEPLLDLLQLFEVNVKEEISIARNALYTSDRSIQEMIFAISESIEDEILKEMRESKHFSIMIDETTDCTITEQLAIHGRFLDKSGELKCHFLKVMDLLQPGDESKDQDRRITASAETIAARVFEFLRQANLDIGKLRGIGTDGAATMVGCRKGVVTRIKEVSPSVLGVHCAAHRLNLASTQAGKSVPYVKIFSRILRQIFDFFDNSAVRTAGLQAVQSLLREKGRLIAPCETRWLSVDRSVNRLKDSFASIVVSLQREGEERGDAKAMGLCKLVSEFRFIATMMLMCDCLPHISYLSKCFQYSNCDYSIIPRMLSSTLTSLTQLKTSDGLNLASLPDLSKKCESQVFRLLCQLIKVKSTLLKALKGHFLRR